MRSLAAVLVLLSMPRIFAQVHTTAYDRGPDGLEAWTDDRHTRLFRTNAEPLGIVVARHGRVVRRIGQADGGPFFWNVMLLPDGRRIAYEHGPFHFVMTCTLMDIRTGKHLADLSCFSDDERASLPEWASGLVGKDRRPPSSFKPPLRAGSTARPRKP